MKSGSKQGQLVEEVELIQEGNVNAEVIDPQDLPKCVQKECESGLNNSISQEYSNSDQSGVDDEDAEYDYLSEESGHSDTRCQLLKNENKSLGIELRLAQTEIKCLKSNHVIEVQGLQERIGNLEMLLNEKDRLLE